MSVHVQNDTCTGFTLSFIDSSQQNFTMREKFTV